MEISFSIRIKFLAIIMLFSTPTLGKSENSVSFALDLHPIGKTNFHWNGYSTDFASAGLGLQMDLHSYRKWLDHNIYLNYSKMIPQLITADDFELKNLFRIN